MTHPACRSTSRWNRLLLPLAFALIFATALLWPGEAHAQVTYTVTAATDIDDGTCDAHCTLREAINAANASAGADTIAFALSSGMSIGTGTPLPTITDAVTIDGYTVTGSSPNTNATGGLNTVLGIELVGGSGPGLSYGLHIDADGVVVKGLVISHYTDAIIIAGTARNVTIAGSFIGPNMSGTASPGWGASNAGIHVDAGATNVTIGGTTAADRNLITSHLTNGITIDRSPAVATSVAIQGNLIGTDVTGLLALPSATPSGGSAIGIAIAAPSALLQADTITIGGALPGLGNVISGIDGVAIDVHGGATSTDPADTLITIKGNLIGPGVDVITPIGNTGAGVAFTGRANATVRGNAIAHNGGVGIGVAADGRASGGHGVLISQNRIYGNTGIGIDLGPGAGTDGRTPNDAGDTDDGANALLNVPVLDRARFDPIAHTLQVAGHMDVEAAVAPYTVEVFISANNGLSRSGYDGAGYLANAPAVTDGAGHATFTLTIPGTFNVGDELSATTTHLEGYTSELSDAIAIVLVGRNISGTVTLPDGRSVEGVQIEITDNNGFTDTADTDPDGEYAFADLPLATYVLTPSLADVAFAPPSATVTNLTVDTTVDFTANPIAQTYTVNATDDVDDGTCDSLHCSLREAIVAANGHPGLDTIAFDIQPAGAVHRIISTDFPEPIADPVLIDGFTQSGSSPNTNATGALNAVLKLELQGSAPDGNIAGFFIVSSGVTIRGFAITGYQFDVAIIDNTGTSGITIAGNYLGTNADGASGTNFSEAGVVTSYEGTVTIGGTTPAARNLIANHNQVGVVITQGQTLSSDVRVLGNLIGTDATGQQSFGNGAGIVLEIDANSYPVPETLWIGDESDAGRNVISGNRGPGIVMSHYDYDDALAFRFIGGNYIGVAADGVSTLGNDAPGIAIAGGAVSHIAGNVIAYNDFAGVTLLTLPTPDGRGVTVSGNTIFANNGPAIDLDDDGRTPNDADDSDTGANDLQNFPVLLSAAETFTGGVAVTGELHSLPNAGYSIQVFSTGGLNHPGVDAKTLLAVTSGTTNASGVMSFSLGVTGVQPGDYLVATATADVNPLYGMTSELSDPIAITALTRYDISGTVTFNGAPMPFAFLQLAGSVETGAMADASGHYTIADVPGPGTYVLTPVTPGYIFTPASVPLSNLTQDMVIDFTAVEDVTEQFLAEGATGSFWKTSIGILNPSSLAAPATVSFLKDNGTTVTITVPVAGPGHAVVDPSEIDGLQAATFSTVVRGPSPAKLLASRTMRWGNDGELGAHAEQAVPAPRDTWYFAEGATSCFKLFYLLVNPGSQDANVQITYALRAPEAPVVLTYTVPAHSRYTVPVNDQPGLKFAEVAAKIEVTNHVPIVAERAMYSSCYGASWRGGHESVGSVAPATSWYLAEGATGTFFDFYLLIANFEDQEATVNVQYLLPDGSSLTKPHTVPAHSRVTIDVAGEDARLAATSAGAVITSTNTVPIVVERSQWWPHGHWYEGHASAGATQAGVEWQLALAEAGGPRRAHSYLLLANTGAAAGAAQVTLVFDDGTTAQLPAPTPLAGNERKTLDLGDVFPDALGRQFGVIVTSVGDTPAPIVVELSIYNSTTLDDADVFWGNGTNVVATRVR